MGSGAGKRDSELMINLLEQMVDTGFQRRSAPAMINSDDAQGGQAVIFHNGSGV